MTDVITVELTADEVHLAASHGLLRRHQKMSGHRGDREQRMRSTWDNEIEGACAELAWCKYRGRYWSGASGLRAKDGGTVDVRWTKHEGRGGLIVYKSEYGRNIVVLMDGFAPVFAIIGWLTVAEARQTGDRYDFGVLVPREKLRRLR